MSALVVLGVMLGHRHPSLVPAAVSRGLTVLGVDTLNPRNAGIDAGRRRDPGHPLAGVAEVAWIPDDRPADVLDRVVAWAREHDVAAVMVLGEPYVEAGGLVTDCLGLPGPGLRASGVCRNKLLQRRHLARWSPRSRLVPADARAEAVTGWDTYPAIVKPVGRSASSGVQRVTGPAGLRDALAGYAPMEPALVEDVARGPELSVESLVAGGRVIFSAPTGKRTNEHFVEMAHTTVDPRLSAETRSAVLAANAAVLDRLEFADGAAHAEFRVGPDGEITLMEVAARPAGDGIYALYHLATGKLLEETLTAILLGEPVTHPVPRRYARQIYLPHEPGILRAVHADGLGVTVSGLDRPLWPAVTAVAPDAPATVHMVQSARPPGARLTEIRESADRSVMVVIDAPTVAELDRMEARCRTAISIEIARAPALTERS